MAKKMSTEEWIERFKSIHGNRYDYSKVKVVNAFTKVEIVCRNHGVFWQTPEKHQLPRNCPKCARKTTTRKKKTKPDEFFDYVTKIHDGRYTYPDRKYTRMQDKILVECPVHGQFRQKAQNHYMGKGCTKCGHDKIASERVRFTTDTFISHCDDVHAGKYDYSKVEYKAATKRVTIGCPIHGDFEQTAQAHYQGHGCPECGIINRCYIGGFGDKIKQWQDSKDSFKESHLYLFRLYLKDGVEVLKYGITTSEVLKRGVTIKSGSRALKVELIKAWPMPLCTAYATEQLIKKDFEPYWHRPVKRFDGWTECLENISEKEVIDYIEQLV